MRTVIIMGIVMPHNQSPEIFAKDFADDSAFERFLLETATPLLDPTFGPQGVDYVVDTEVANIRALFRDVVSHSDAHLERLQLGPLLFGAAWKILDVLLEHAFDNAHLARRNPNRWEISEKRQHALSFAGQASPLSTERQIWEPLLLAYANSVETRHALVHRRVHVDKDGALVGHAANGAPLTPIPKIEQTVFQRAITRAADAVISGNLLWRSARNLKIELDYIPTLTLRPTTSVESVGLSPPIQVAIQARSGVTANLDEIVKKILSIFPSSTDFDFHFEIDSVERFSAEVQDIPKGLSTFEFGPIPIWAECS